MTTPQDPIQQFQNILKKKIGVHKMLDLLDPIVDSLTTVEQKEPIIDDFLDIYEHLDILDTYIDMQPEDLSVSDYWDVQTDLIKCHKKLYSYPIAGVAERISIQLAEYFKNVTTRIEGGTDVPECPKCSAPMIIRVNGETGQEFFGCSQFPNCRCTRPL